MKRIQLDLLARVRTAFLVLQDILVIISAMWLFVVLAITVFAIPFYSLFFLFFGDFSLFLDFLYSAYSTPLTLLIMIGGNFAVFYLFIILKKSDG